MSGAKHANSQINNPNNQNLLGFFKILVDIKMANQGSKINNKIQSRHGNGFRTIENRKLTLKNKEK